MKPTYNQHKILESIKQDGPMAMTGEEEDMEEYWELVRNDYLKNLALMMGKYEWKFILTSRAQEYLESN
jgi:hypothetical protein